MVPSVVSLFVERHRPGRFILVVECARDAQHTRYVFRGFVATNERHPVALDGYGLFAFLWCVEYERFSE
jgi:hypothetical protein